MNREPFSVNDFLVTPKTKTVGDYLRGTTSNLRKQRIRAIYDEPHNIEIVCVRNDVTFINDSWATNLNRTWYTLERIGKPVILILGKEKKGYATVTSLCYKLIRGIVWMKPNGLKEAVAEAERLARKGDTVLFSPGCSSLSVYSDYKERGEQFKRCVRELPD